MKFDINNIISDRIRLFLRKSFDHFNFLLFLHKPLKELHPEFKQNKETKNDLNFEDDQSNVFPTGFDNVENLKMISAGRGDPIVCRLEPFNLCYRFDKSGTMHPLGNRRPVRLIRVYK